MSSGKKTVTTHALANSTGPPATPGNNSRYQGFRNLRKSDLAGVIFGCTHNTMKECLTKQLFGLPAAHFSYIRNIDAGLPLFLFNYSDRRLHGAFEAAGPGQMNIDMYAWSDNSTVRTPFPAQVRICTKTECIPLNEARFKKAILENYYTYVHFFFELDHAQMKQLISLFKPIKPGYAPYSVPVPINLPPTTTRNAQPNISYKQTLDYLKLSNPASAPVPGNQIECSKATTSERAVQDNWDLQGTWADVVEWEDHNYINNAESGFDAGYDNLELSFGSNQFGISSRSEVDEQIVLNKLRALAIQREESMGCPGEDSGNRLPPEAELEVQVPCEPFSTGHLHLTQSDRNNELTQIAKELVVQTRELQKKQVKSSKEIELLNDIAIQSERKIVQLESWIEDLERRLGPPAQLPVLPEKLIYLVGGFDRLDWLSSFDAFLASKDSLTPVTKMSSARAYALVAALGEVIFVLGGSDGNLWSDIVECYNMNTDEWIQCPPLSCSKGSLAGTTLGGKIFAIGGGDKENCSSCVEILDPSLGKWVFGQSMNQKRFAPAAAELNGAIYTVGGFDGKCYLESAERYDPREGYWARLPSMTERRGCVSLAAMSENLYAVGGFDGRKMLSSMEIFDPRLPAWFPGRSMQTPRGYAASALIDDTFYMMGGLSNGDEVTEIVECFNCRTGWCAPGLKSIGKRCCFSAVVL